MEDIEKSDLPRFGEFHAVSELGRGATSTVYLAVKKFERAAAGPAPGGEEFPDLMPAEATPLPQRVAVKVVNFTDESTKLSRRFRKLFATEAWVASQLDHPNITKVFNWKVEDERAYLVMEHLEGETLDSFVSLDKLLPVQQVVDIIHKVAVALDYAHRRGVVNRDIKPANVMLCANGEIKVMDFGLALNIKKNVDIDSTYINGLGSPSYMSPEQIKGYTLNHQTDLYSLGVMFYQLLTGRLPFRAKNTAALIYQIINMSPVPVTQLNPELPAFTDLVIAKAMEKDLYSRYRLGANFAKDLSDAPYQRVKVSQTVNLDVRWKALRALTALGDIDDLDIWELLRASSWRELPPATVIMREGEEGKSFGIVVKGLVELENSDRAFTIAARGDFVGATEWLDKGAPKRMCTATTLDNVVYLEIHPVAFEYATEELAEIINRLAMESVLKRLRVATRLARAQSPLAIHPAPEPVTEEPATSGGAVPGVAAAPENPLGWGVFSGVDANTPAAAPTPSKPPLAPPLPAPVQPRPTSVVVQPMPASAAAAIAQAALGRAPEPPAAFHLDSSATTEFTSVPLIPDDDRSLPAPPHGADSAASNAMLTTEMAPNYSATTAFSTSEMAPNFGSTTALDHPSDLPPDPMSDGAAPLFEMQEGTSTSEMAPNFAGTTAFSIRDYEPSAGMATATSEMAPNFDGTTAFSIKDDEPSSGTATSEMAPQYSATTAFSAADFAMPALPTEPAEPTKPAGQALSPTFAQMPQAPAAPLGRPAPAPAAAPKPDRAVLTTELAPEFDKTSAFDAADFAVPSLPDEDMPSEPLLAAFSVSEAASPAAALAKTAPRKMSDFDPDKTVMLQGGFEESSSKDEAFTENMFPPSNSTAPGSMFSATVRARPTAPEDFDKTVEISGGFEAQPIDEEAPLDDLFPPIKF